MVPSGDMSWCAVLEHHAIRAPDRAMTVFEGRTTTYGEMAAQVAASAAGLAGRGVGAGDVVALLSYNCPEFLETVFAANHLGAVAMPINWRLAAPEVRYILENSGARTVVADSALVALADDALAGMDSPPLRVAIDPSAPNGWTPLAELRTPAGATPHVPAAADDLHRLMYTSGTTGHPKGVMLTHANLAWKNAAHIVEFGFTERGSRARVRPAVPRRRARPHDHHAHRRGRDHDPAPRVRRGRGRRRARALAASRRCGSRRPW